jgi:taurine dioxygenase
MKIRVAGDGIGAEVSGVDVKTISDRNFAKIYQAWIDHNVVVVKDQHLTIPEFLAYSRRFGIIEPHPAKATRHPDYPEITLLGVNKFNPDGSLNQTIYRRGAEGWHTDGAYEAIPFKATQLYALAIPDRGGDTYFALGYAAYDALPQAMKDRLEGVLGAFTYGTPGVLNPEDEDWKPALHKAIRTHRESGRKSLYFGHLKIVSPQGLEKAESDDPIAELKARTIQPNGQYVDKWSVGDIVIWDNRCSYHKTAGDYPPEQDRIHWRVSIKDWPDAAA